MKKNLCIYHSADLDGWMSAAIVKHWDKMQPDNRFKEHFTYLGYNYGDPDPDISGYDMIIMLDIALPEHMMEAMHADMDLKVVWIDHHISSMKKYEKYNFPGQRDEIFAACEIAWDYFFTQEDCPDVVYYIGSYDSFRFKNLVIGQQEILNFQFGARHFIKDMEDAYHVLIKTRDNIFHPIIIDQILPYGKIIYEYLKSEAKSIYNKRFDILFPDNFTKNGLLKFAAINRDRFNPGAMDINYHKDGYDGFASFHYKDKKWAFSLYSQQVDCSVIAGMYGGGGHKGAAGFIIDDIRRVFPHED